MEAKEVNFTKLNEAVEKFGSLQQTNVQLEKDKLALEKGNNQLKEDNNKLTATSNKLASQIKDMDAKTESHESQLKSLAKKIEVYSYQYELFCGFMAMVAASPSVNDSVDTLITSFQKLKEPGWYLPNNADEMRSLFVRMVMGDYLKSFRCCSCGTKFIINKKPKYSNGYQCPVCHDLYVVKEEDSFLKALVSKKQMENIILVEDILKENIALEPLKSFMDVPCEICGKPITEWTKDNVYAAINECGWGHDVCWNTGLGKVKMAVRLDSMIQKKQ